MKYKEQTTAEKGHKKGSKHNINYERFYFGWIVFLIRMIFNLNIFL